MNNNVEGKSNVLNKVKRVFALAGAVLLALMYIMTLVFAVTDNPETMTMFKASLILTIILPIFLYAYQLTFRVLKSMGRIENNSEGNK